jgi:hypothetical protein
MRTIDTRWGFLTQGLQLAGKLDAAQRAQSEPTFAGSNTQAVFERKNYERQLKHYRQHNANYPRFLAAWQAQEKRARERLNRLCFYGILSACSVVGLPVSLVLAFNVARQYRTLKEIEARRPERPTPPASRRSRLALRIEGIGKQTAGDVVEGWWRSLAIQNGEQRNFGSLGADVLLEHFSKLLPDSYIAIKELLVQHGLDVDVLLIGPTGIWVLEVKHLAGQVFYRQGRWYQLKGYYEEGGNQKTKMVPFEANLDEQWQRERDNVERTIRRRIPDMDWIASHIHGGIAFTHPEVVPRIDPTCKVAWGSPADWLSEIQHQPLLGDFTLQRQLYIADALLEFAHQIEPAYGEESAVDLARQVHDRLSGQN